MNLTDTAAQSDFILRPGLEITASLPLTEVNAVYASLNLSYAKYMSHPQYDRFIVQPGSELGFDVYVSDFHINFHNRISYTENPVAQPELSGVADFGEFSDTAGTAIDWRMHNLTLSLGYDHNVDLSATSQFSYLNRSTDSAVGRITFQPATTFDWGFEVSASWTAYEKAFLNDNASYSLGAFLDVPVSDYIRLTPRAGYIIYTFAQTGVGPPQRDQNLYYASLHLEHRLNEKVSYNVEGGRQIEQGTYAELVDSWFARAGISAKLIQDVGTAFNLFFENGNENGTTILNLNQSFTRAGFGLTASYRLTPKVIVRAGYEYAAKTSNIPAFGYHQNRLTINLESFF